MRRHESNLVNRLPRRSRAGRAGVTPYLATPTPLRENVVHKVDGVKNRSGAQLKRLTRRAVVVVPISPISPAIGPWHAARDATAGALGRKSAGLDDEQAAEIRQAAEPAAQAAANTREPCAPPAAAESEMPNPVKAG